MKDDRQHGNRTRFWGILLIVVGSLFFFESIGLFDIGDFIGAFWPVILIIIGLWMIVKSKRETAESKNSETQSACIGDQEASSRSDKVAMSKLPSVQIAFNEGISAPSL